MNNELIRFYNTCGLDAPILNNDIFSINHVGNDNITNILADLFGSKWTYEISKEEVVNINNTYYIMATIILYTPCKIATGISTVIFTNEKSREVAIKDALVDAFNNIIYRQPLKANIVSNKEDVINSDAENRKEVIETKEKIEDHAKEVEQTDISRCEEQIDAISASELSALEEEIKNTPTPIENNGGIRKDQIEFLNSFKEKNNIDTDNKFNYYVRVWSDTTSYNISTKRELATAGASVIDEFIKWVQEIVIDRVENREVVSPI